MNSREFSTPVSSSTTPIYDEKKKPVSPFGFGGVFSINRGYAQYNPDHSIKPTQKSRSLKSVQSELSTISPKIQRRIRDELNIARSPDQQISYAHIKPTSPDFNKSYAQLILRHYTLSNYLKQINEQHDTQAIDPEVLAQISGYSKKKLKHHFALIPVQVKHEIMDALALNPDKPIDYSIAHKQQIVAVFQSQYMS